MKALLEWFGRLIGVLIIYGLSAAIAMRVLWMLVKQVGRIMGMEEL